MQKSPLYILVVSCLFACASDPVRPPERYTRPPVERPVAMVNIREIWNETTETAYRELTRQFGHTRSIPSATPQQRARCAEFPPLYHPVVPDYSPHVALARECAYVAAAKRLRTETQEGLVCVPDDDACLKRRARRENARVNGTRFDRKSPQCSIFLYRFWKFEQNNPTWRSTCAFRLFEATELRDNAASWTTSEFRACLAPSIPGFADASRCLTEATDGKERLYTDVPTPLQTQKEQLAIDAENFYRKLKSVEARCKKEPGKAHGETRLERSAALQYWDSLRSGDRGPMLRREIDSIYGDGALDSALSEAKRHEANFHSQMCVF